MKKFQTSILADRFGQRHIEPLFAIGTRADARVVGDKSAPSSTKLFSSGLAPA